MNEFDMFLYVQNHIFRKAFTYFLVHRLGMGIESDAMGGKGLDEIPPSHAWPCSVENKLLSKQGEDH